MPEVKRLNEPVVCNGCSTQVNPYVMQTKSLVAEGKLYEIHLECPTCGYDWWQENESWDE